MPRAFWKGTLSFGLVEIPVALRPAVASDELSFTLLDKRDFSPVGYKHYNKSTGREVGWDQIVRGFEYEPHEYVVLTEEELRGANPDATQTIEIVEFVDESEIDPVFCEAPYFLEPQKKGSRAYELLREALERSGKAGIAQVVLRTRQRVAAVVVREGAVVLILLRYAYELKEPSTEAVETSGRKKEAVSSREVDMAEQLIDTMSASWDPKKFRDTYRDDVMALVKKKVQSGNTHAVLPAEAPKGRARRAEVSDLMPLLKQSLERAPRKGRTRAHARGRENGEERRRRRAS